MSDTGMTSEEQSLADDKMRAEIAKIIAEMFKINAEMLKINSETSKINSENRWYPAVLAAGFTAGLITLTLTLAKIFLP